MANNFINRLLIQIAILAGAAVVVGAIIFLLSQDIAARSETILNNNDKIADQIGKQSNLLNLRSDAKIAEASLAELDAMIPTKDYLLSFSSAIKKLAVSDNLDSTFQFGPEGVAEGGLNTINFTMALQGGVSDIMKFVEDLGAWRYFVRVSDVNIVGQPPRYSANIGAYVIFKAVNEKKQ